MTPRVLRVGVVGLGMMGRNHVRVLRAMDQVELVGVADPAGDVHRAAGGIPIYSDVEQLLKEGLDLCTVAVPTDTHESLGLRLAQAGIPTLIEKPLAADVASGQRLVAAFAKAGVVACVGHIERHNAAIKSLKQRLAIGELGDVYQVTTSRQGPFPHRIRDVGVVKDLATHDLDLTSWITNSAYASVAASTVSRTGRPYEDLVVIVGRLTDETVTNHLVNWLSPVKERTVTVTGALGRLTADTLTADLTFHANGIGRSEWDELSQFRGVTEGDMTRFALVKPEPLAEELRQFCAAVRGEPSVVVTLEDGLRTLEVAEAVLRSAASHTVEAIAP